MQVKPVTAAYGLSIALLSELNDLGYYNSFHKIFNSFSTELGDDSCCRSNNFAASRQIIVIL